MAQQSALIAEDIEAYLKAHEVKSLLRFLTCGAPPGGMADPAMALWGRSAQPDKQEARTMAWVSGQAADMERSGLTLPTYLGKGYML